MQVLIELIAGFVALLASLALAQFGVDLQPPRPPVQEIRRIDNCGDPPAPPSPASSPVERLC